MNTMTKQRLSVSAYHPSHTLIIKDPWSAFTHFLGILGSAYLTPLLLLHAMQQKASFLEMLALSIFMLGAILLYSASTMYHTFQISPKLDRFLKKWDHMMIFVLIAASYTPVCLISLRDSIGRKLLLFVWSFAIVGMIFKFCWVTCPKWVSSVIYIGMGWSCIVAIPKLYEVLSAGSFFWLLLGGLIYTAGGILYALKLKALNDRFPSFGSHEIFHVCVMFGNLCHFICIWQLV